MIMVAVIRMTLSDVLKKLPWKVTFPFPLTPESASQYRCIHALLFTHEAQCHDTQIENNSQISNSVLKENRLVTVEKKRDEKKCQS